MLLTPAVRANGGAGRRRNLEDPECRDNDREYNGGH